MAKPPSSPGVWHDEAHDVDLLVGRAPWHQAGGIAGPVRAAMDAAPVVWPHWAGTFAAIRHTPPPVSEADIRRLGRALGASAHLRDLPGQVPRRPRPERPFTPPPINCTWSRRRGRFLSNRAYGWLQGLAIVGLLAIAVFGSGLLPR